MNQIRFQAFNDRNELVAQSDWYPEHTSLDAPAVLAKFRAETGNDRRYQIKRVGDSREPNRPKMYRFRIEDKADNLFYSRLIAESEKDETFGKIRAMYPEATITEEVA